MREFQARSVGSLMLVTGLVCSVAGCGSGGETATRSAARESRPTAVPGSASAVAIDACSLLPADDVAALLNATVAGQPSAGGLHTYGCVWRNPSTYESVSLEIGSPDTAVNGTLPPVPPDLPEVVTPGPDGMRFLGGGMVEFPAAGRSNTVQVAVLSMSRDEANAAAVELARKVGPQIPR